MGVSALKFGATGDGVPGTVLAELPLPTKGSVVFNFSDPKEVKIETEGRTAPLYSHFVKDTTDFIEFSIPSAANSIWAELAGGIHDEGTVEAPKDIWKEPVSVPSINKTFVVESEVHQGKKVIYTIVNGKILAKPGQAPGSEQSDTLLVRVYKQAAVTAAGVENYAFSREVVSVAG